jgi:hypothetical protein
MGFLYRLFRKSDDGKVVLTKPGVTLVPGNVAENQAVPGMRVSWMFALPAMANGNTDLVIPYKARILDAYVIQQEAAMTSGVVRVYNGANAVSSTMSTAAADTTIARATTIDEAYYDVAAGGTLRITSSGGATQPKCLVVVEGVLMA